MQALNLLVKYSVKLLDCYIGLPALSTMGLFNQEDNELQHIQNFEQRLTFNHFGFMCFWQTIKLTTKNLKLARKCISFSVDKDLYFSIKIIKFLNTFLSLSVGIFL